ncbi:histone-lysine N-methyltransferase 2D-like [Manacus vitellinus]|uniref:histone-lysine N-methyltransferase 2D-like n=1 Tax=Manacus vitellinus TaxID=328815 RepID=UPI00115F0F4E|nr:histone-lysine N-methyltransferase 2D-like [Manacus vitellinus]
MQQQLANSFFPDTDLDKFAAEDIMDPIAKAKMVALKGIKKVMAQGSIGVAPGMNRQQVSLLAQRLSGGPAVSEMQNHLLAGSGQERSGADPTQARPNPPTFAQGVINEADQRQYEEWLFHTQQLLQMQLKVLEEQIGAHRKSRKALCAKQRTAKKAGREFPEADAEKLKLVTEQQSKIQKQLDQVRKQQKEHTNLMAEYRNKQQQHQHQASAVMALSPSQSPRLMSKLPGQLLSAHGVQQPGGELSLLPLTEPTITANFSLFAPFGSSPINGKSQLRGAFGSAVLDSVPDYYSQLLTKNNLSNPPTPPSSLPPTPPPSVQQKMVNGVTAPEELGEQPKDTDPAREPHGQKDAPAVEVKSLDLLAALPTPPHNQTEDVRMESDDESDSPDSIVPASSPESVLGEELLRFPLLSEAKPELEERVLSPIIPIIPRASIPVFPDTKPYEAAEPFGAPPGKVGAAGPGAPWEKGKSSEVSVMLTVSAAAAKNLNGVMVAMAELLSVKIPSSYEVLFPDGPVRVAVVEAKKVEADMAGMLGGKEKTDGPARLLNLDLDLWVHLNCALWSTEVYETQGGALINVEVALHRGLLTKCSLCQKTGATNSCNRIRCPSVYHFACAIRAKCMFFKDKTMLCPLHKLKGPCEQELSSFTVFRRVYIERDEVKQIASIIQRGERLHMFRVGGLVFHAIGQLLPHQMADFHSVTALYPVGYEATRIYWSLRTNNRRCCYRCTICENNGRPEFVVQVIEQGLEDLVFSDSSPQAVWNRIIEPVAMMRKEADMLRLFPEYLKGEELFGLTVHAVLRIAESLPGVESCQNYLFRYGRHPLMELPLMINPTGCARSEPKILTHYKR